MQPGSRQCCAGCLYRRFPNQRARGITRSANETHHARVANNSSRAASLWGADEGGIFAITLSARRLSASAPAAAAASEADDVIYRSALQSYKLYRTLSRASEREKGGCCCCCVCVAVVAAAVHINSGDYTRSQGVDAAGGRGAAGWPPPCHTALTPE
jgi:hypothetical protein